MERAPGDLAALRLLSACYVKVGDTQAETGEIAGGIEMLGHGLRVGESVYARKTGELADFLLLIRGYERLGDAQLHQRNPMGALKSYRRTLEVSERLAAEFPGARAQNSLALTHSRIGDALAERGDLIETMKSYRQALVIREALVGDYPSNAAYSRELKVLYNWLGNFSGNPHFLNLGDRAAALEYYRRGLVIAEQLAVADPKNVTARHDLAVSVGKMGDILAESDPASGAESYRRGLAITRALLDDAPEELRYRRRHVMFLNGRASALRNLGDRNGAIHHLRQSLETLQQAPVRFATNPELLALKHAALHALAALLLETGDPAGALDHNRQALAIAEAASGSIATDLYARWRLADSYSRLGEYYATLGANTRNTPEQRIANWREARSWCEKSLLLWDEWTRHAVSSVFNTTRRDQAARALERCDAALSSAK